MSVASLFGYRSGTLPISSKGWSKLEQLERQTLEADRQRRIADSKANVKDRAEEELKIVQENPAPYGAKKSTDLTLEHLDHRLGNLEHSMGRMSAILERIAIALEGNLENSKH